MAAMFRKERGVFSEKLIPPRSERSEKCDVDISRVVCGIFAMGQDGMIAEMQKRAAQAASAISQNAQRIDVRDAARIDGPAQIALKPMGFGLFGAEKKCVPR